MQSMRHSYKSFYSLEKSCSVLGNIQVFMFNQLRVEIVNCDFVTEINQLTNVVTFWETGS